MAARLMRPGGASGADLAAARRFRAVLEAEGVWVRGPIRAAPEPSRVRVRVTRWAGPSVLRLVWVALKHSDNFAAERLLQMAGSSIGDPTIAGGLRVVRAWESRLGVPSGRHGDGSGRSLASRHTAWNQVAWLRAAERTPVASFFRLSLPVACQGGGTLSHRMCRTPAEGRVFAKTGNVRGVVTLAGYVLARSGREVRFSFMLSGVRSKPAARRAIDRALVRIVRYA